MKIENDKIRLLKHTACIVLLVMLTGCGYLRPKSRYQEKAVDPALQVLLNSIDKPTSPDSSNLWLSWEKTNESIKGIKLGNTKLQVLQAYFDWVNKGGECPVKTRQYDYRSQPGGKTKDTFSCGAKTKAIMTSYQVGPDRRLMTDNQGNILPLMTGNQQSLASLTEDITYTFRLDQFEGNYLSTDVPTMMNSKPRGETLKVIFVQGHVVSIENAIPQLGKCALFYELLVDKYGLPDKDKSWETYMNLKWLSKGSNNDWRITAYLPCSTRIKTTKIKLYTNNMPKQYFKLAEKYLKEMRLYRKKIKQVTKEFEANQNVGEIKL